MARYTGPRSRLSRRLGVSLPLKGAKIGTDKDPYNRRPYAPGEHGQARAKKSSDYGLQLREKQKVRAIYGVLERQFRKAFQTASRAKGQTGVRLLEIMERRLDNAIYRLGFAMTRAQARQWVAHGHVKVNGRKVNVPSFSVRPGEVIQIHGSEKLLQMAKEAKLQSEERAVPAWLERDPEKFEGTVKGIPKREDVQFPIKEQLIVELYSK
ncbi:MAG: 30S ribosomal protein S4 [Candidatus Omnitrophica bacterium CG11_big_fil_rev_8_21_14_0_20_64_10]|nr:MAG: 30S ribosomal protein S4 [Candidatus Omnitrophica bacterium CG11_big_fil_rev_8_21_14_0_20_64_10]